MPRTYSIDGRKERDSIRKAIIDGQSISQVSRDYGLDRKTVAKYKAEVILPTLATSGRAQAIRAPENRSESIAEIAERDNLLARIERVTCKLEAIIERADVDDPQGFGRFIVSVRELRGYLALLAEARGVTAPKVVVNWYTLRSVILQATEDAPEIRDRIIQAMPGDEDE